MDEATAGSCRRMAWQGAGTGAGIVEPVFRWPMSLTLDDHMAVDGHRWLKQRRGFVLVFMLIGFALGLFQGYGDLRAGEMPDFVITLAVTLALFAALAVPAHRLVARGMRRVLEQALKRRGLLGKRFVLEVSRDGIRLEDEPVKPGADVVSSRFPWSAIRAVEHDAERYLFWIERKRAIILHRDLFVSEVDEAAFRERLADFAAKPLVTPPAFARDRRGRTDDWGEA